MSENELSERVRQYAYGPPPEVEPGKRRLAVRCRYCNSARTKVRQSYPNGIRLRFCLSCKRPFRTKERAVEEPG